MERAERASSVRIPPGQAMAHHAQPAYGIKNAVYVESLQLFTNHAILN